MCKYCELTEFSKGEFVSADGTIMSIKDGSQVMDLRLNRYISDKPKTHDSELIFDYGVKVGDAVYSIRGKSIKIKYCPFCGEKL